MKGVGSAVAMAALLVAVLLSDRAIADASAGGARAAAPHHRQLYPTMARIRALADSPPMGSIWTSDKACNWPIGVQTFFALGVFPRTNEGCTL